MSETPSAPLTTCDTAICLAFATMRYPNHRLRPLERQGACSYTLLAEPSTSTDDGEVMILQFRLPQHALSLALAHAAQQVYAPLAPRTKGLGWVGPLQGLAMEKLPGDRWGDLRPCGRELGGGEKLMEGFRRLMDGFAGVFGQNWKATATALGVEEGVVAGGKVGASILARLGRLARELPSRALRSRAREVEGAVHRAGLEGLPMVLTHGDLLPANVLVDGRTWGITGLVDWAEAEWLPFGIGLYGLEHLLGFLDGEGRGPRRPRFVYYDRADELRDVFWARLEALVGELKGEEMRQKALLARDVGVLLWRGFAWDDGSIDRVVNWGDDAEEMACLEAFLGIEASSGRHDSVMDLDLETDEPADVIPANEP